MKHNSVQQYYFSATGTTQKVVQAIARHFSKESVCHNLLRQPLSATEALTADTLAIIGMPVYGGRIPAHCADMLKKLKGTNTPAIAVVVYGNRDYDDALLELSEILTNNGFLVLGAGAFVAQHSIFPRTAIGRPDRKDLLKIADFARQCGIKLEQITSNEKPLKVKGGLPYKKVASVPLRPSAGSSCTSCGVCAGVCPVGAINKENPKITDKKLCISCAACIANCPHNARDFRGIIYKLFGKLFGRLCRNRREPEVFI